MPIFEYNCEHCGNTMEKIQRQPLDSLTCNACGKEAARSVSLTSVATSSGGSCGAPAGGGFA